MSKIIRDIRGIEFQKHCDTLDSKGMCFALCSSPAKGFKQATCFDTCRESLLTEMMLYHDEDRSVYARNDIDTKKTRILVSMRYENIFGEESKQSKILEGYMSRGLRLVHHFEKMAKWPLSKLFEVKHTRIKNGRIYLFIGNRRWQKSPHMLSLYTLLIRMGRFEEFGKFKSHARFKEICKRITSKDVNSDKNVSILNKEYDIGFIRSMYPNVDLLMKHFDKLFGKKPTPYFFTRFEDVYDATEGIEALFEHYTEDGETDIKFSKICEKYRR